MGPRLPGPRAGQPPGGGEPRRFLRGLAKIRASRDKSSRLAIASRELTLSAVPGPSEPPDFPALYAEHAEFVWRSLFFMGIRRADLPDVHQEVFLTFLRRQDAWDRSKPLRGWLWGIAVGLVKNHRRRAFRRLEVPLETNPGGSVVPGDLEAGLDAVRAQRRALRAFSALDPERRAVFVMFEVEGMSGKEIAAELMVPLGTVHSRLHAARQVLAAALSEGEEGTS
jgi:RNA polymerase sigma-70 factor (ECF subfamily)